MIICFLFLILIWKGVVFLCIVYGNSCRMIEYEFLYSRIERHFTTYRTVGIAREFYLTLFSESDKIEPWSCDFIWIFFQSIHNGSLFCMNTTCFVGNFCVKSFFFTLTSATWFEIFCWGIISRSYDNTIFYYNTSAFRAFACSKKGYFSSLFHIWFCYNFIVSFEFVHRYGIIFQSFFLLLRAMWVPGRILFLESLARVFV